MNLMKNLMEFEVVPRRGAPTRRQVEVKSLSLAVSRVPPKTLRKSRYLLTNENEIEVEGTKTLGEVEYVAIAQKAGEILITAGSDHLDLAVAGMVFRNARREADPAKAKQLCPAVVAREAWLYTDVKNHWNSLRLRSTVTIDGQSVVFQDYPITELVDLLTHLRVNPKLWIEGSVLFSGSADKVPSAPANLYNLKAGDAGIFPSDFHFELLDPVLGRAISHSYKILVVG